MPNRDNSSSHYYFWKALPFIEGIRYTQPIACNINIGYFMVRALKVFWLKNNFVMNFLALHWCSFFIFLFIIWAVICMQLPISIKDSQLLAEDTFLIQPKISTFLILTRYIHSSLDQNFSKLAVCHVLWFKIVFKGVIKRKHKKTLSSTICDGLVCQLIYQTITHGHFKR